MEDKKFRKLKVYGQSAYMQKEGQIDNRLKRKMAGRRWIRYW